MVLASTTEKVIVGLGEYICCHSIHEVPWKSYIAQYYVIKQCNCVMCDNFLFTDSHVVVKPTLVMSAIIWKKLIMKWNLPTGWSVAFVAENRFVCVFWHTKRMKLSKVTWFTPFFFISTTEQSPFISTLSYIQPYSAERPCVGCKNSMTRKSGPHWEGGKGCRDKIKMSR